MMSLGAIRSMSEKAARRAASQNRVPYVPFDASEVERMPPIPFPFLGSHIPDGWEAVEGGVYFVDSSGFGEDYEPAMSVQQFKQVLLGNLPHGYGYGVVQAGEFQVYVQAYTAPAGYKSRRHPVKN